MVTKEITLIKVDSNQNNNKFYRVSLDGGTITKTCWKLWTVKH